MNIHRKLSAALLASLFLSSTAHANLIYTVSGTSSTGSAINAQVDFTLGASSLTAVVTNLIVNQNNVGQNVSGLFFTLSGISSLSLGSQLAPETVNVVSGGAYTVAGTNINPGWGFQAGPPSGVNALSGALSTPALTILGAPDASNKYSNANASIAGNIPHNPFIYETASFVFDFTQLPRQSVSLSGIQLNFGTATDLHRLSCAAGCTSDNTPGVPEPGVFALLGLGFAMLALTRRRMPGGSRNPR